MGRRTIVHLIVAARPNFMKIAPLYHTLCRESWCEPVIVHTGQHYDANMSDAFFENLRLPSPAIHLGIGGGSHAEQTGRLMIVYEKVLLEKSGPGDGRGRRQFHGSGDACRRKTGRESGAPGGRPQKELGGFGLSGIIAK